MKKLLLILFIITNVFADENINSWFNQKFAEYKPYIKEITNFYSYEKGYNEANIYINNKFNEKVKISTITYIDDIGGDSSLIRACSPEIEKVKEKFIIKYEKNCTIRLSEQAYKRFVLNYMKTLENNLSNAINKTYKEETEEKFKIYKD